MGSSPPVRRPKPIMASISACGCRIGFGRDPRVRIDRLRLISPHERVIASSPLSIVAVNCGPGGPQPEILRYWEMPAPEKSLGAARAASSRHPAARLAFHACPMHGARAIYTAGSCALDAQIRPLERWGERGLSISILHIHHQHSGPIGVPGNVKIGVVNSLRPSVRWATG